VLSLEKAPGRAHSSLPVLPAAQEKDGDKLLSRGCGDGAGGDGFRLKEGRFRLDGRQKFFLLGVVNPWPGLPRGGRCRVPGHVPGQAGRGSG